MNNYPKTYQPLRPEAPWNAPDYNQNVIDGLMAEAQEKLAGLKEILGEIKFYDPSFSIESWWEGNI